MIFTLNYIHLVHLYRVGVASNFVNLVRYSLRSHMQVMNFVILLSFPFEQNSTWGWFSVHADPYPCLYVSVSERKTERDGKKQSGRDERERERNNYVMRRWLGDFIVKNLFSLVQSI